MTLTVTFTNDAFPPETEFSVEGIGSLKNGEATEVSDEQEAAFIANYRQLPADALTGEAWNVSGGSANSVEEVLGVNPEEISTEPVVVPVEEEAPAEAPVVDQQTTIDLGPDTTTTEGVS